MTPEQEHTAIEQHYFEKIMKIAVCIGKTYEETFAELATLTRILVFSGPRHGDYLNWLIEYAAQFGELPQVVQDSVVVRAAAVQDSLDIIQGLTGDNPPQGSIVVKGRPTLLEEVQRMWKPYGVHITSARLDPVLDGDGWGGISSAVEAKKCHDLLVQHAKERERQVGVPAVAPIRSQTAKTGRNSPCPCGSGKKYKACCLRP